MIDYGGVKFDWKFDPDLVACSALYARELG